MYRLRVPWEHRATAIGWGRRARARWNHPGRGPTQAVIVSEGKAGCLARDEEGNLHALPEGAYERHEYARPKAQPLAKAVQPHRVWIAPHTREGHPVAGHWRELETGTEYPAPEPWGGPIHIEETDGTDALVRHRNGSKVRMPLASVPHYVQDAAESLPHPATTGDPAIDGVLKGQGRRIGKGNDGIVYRAPTGEAVKISTTTPYQPHNAGHRSPEGAVAHLRNEYEAHQALGDLAHIPTVHGQEHDGRFFLVKPWAPEAEHLTHAELDSVAHTIEEMHRRGWTLNDTVQLGRDAQDRIWFQDLGQAHDHASTGEMGHDIERLDELFRANGHSRALKGEELEKKLWALGFLMRRGPSGIPAREARERSMFAEWSRMHDAREAELTKEDIAAMRSKDPARMDAADAAWKAHSDAGKEMRAKWGPVLRDLEKAVGYTHPHADPERLGSPADRRSSPTPVRGAGQPGERGGMLFVVRVPGSLRVWDNLHPTDRNLPQGASSGMGAGESSTDPGGSGHPPLVRHAGLLQPGAPATRDAGGQLRGRLRAWTESWWPWRGAPQREADVADRRGDPTTASGWRELRGPGAGVRGGSRSDQPDLHRQGVDHPGGFRAHQVPANPKWVDLNKGDHADIPPGARWVTARPNGPGTEGHPILIVPAGDGTHRVIGGAGGSMNHLRLKDVKSEAEMREKSKAKRKEKQGIERSRRAGLSKEDRDAEDSQKELEAQRQTDAERAVIKTVREKWGGVDPDLDADATAGLSDAAAQKLHDQHHRKQLRQANKARQQIARSLARDRVEQIEDEAAVDASIREEPDQWADAQEAGTRELAQIEAETEARRATRTPMGDRSIAEEKHAKAAETAAKVLEKTDRDAAEKELEGLGGRAARGQRLGETASEEAKRRAAEATDAALILHDAAEGRPPSDDPVRAQVEFDVITNALKRAQLPADADAETTRAALATEAAIALQQSQLHKLKAAKFEAMEGAGHADRAMRALVKTDVLRGLTDEVRDATKRLGLRPDAKTPLKQAEIAEMMEILGSFDQLKKAKASLDTVVEKAEPAEYDASRRAFQLHMSEPPDHVVEHVDELVRRELAQRIVGMADTHSSAHVKAVADGHYAQLANVSLAVSNASHVDRSTVDALGLKNAGFLLRHALEGQGHKADDLHNALVGHHVREQVKITADALRAADAFVPDLEQTVNDAGGIEHALQRLDASEADLDAAQRQIGSALGQMEATATLGQVFRGKAPDHLAIDLKDGGTGVGLASKLTWLASVGLEPADYEVDTANKQIRIPKESWGKLLQTEDKKTTKQRETAHAIKRGDDDEEGWMPEGMVSRSSTSFTDPPASAPRYHTGLDLGASDIHTALGDHIGSRLADGERPADIATDLLSPQIAGKSADPEAFTDIVRGFFPTQTDEDRAQHVENHRIRGQREHLNTEYKAARERGDHDQAEQHATAIAQLPAEKEVQPKRDVHFAEHYEQLAAQFMKRHHPDASPAHAASLYQPGVDEKQVREAVFRSLASNPEHVAAFTPIGELQPEHRKALQSHFYKRAGIEEGRDWSKEFHEALVTGWEDPTDPVDTHQKSALERAQGGAGDQSKAVAAAGGLSMFGGGAPAAPRKEVNAENFGELYPKEAKELAYKYPREGAALHAQAMGPRPAEPATPSKLAPHVSAAIDAVRERHPAMPAHELATEAAQHLGREKAKAKLGITEEQLSERDDTGKLTDRAKLAKGKIDAEGKNLAERGIDPREVSRVYAGKIHDAEGAAFEDHKQRNATPWSQFVSFHGDLGTAYQALQEEMRGDFAKNLQSHYGKLTGKGLQTSIAEVPNAELHAQAITSPRGRAALAEARRKEIDASRGRGAAGARDEEGKALGGKFSAGSALEKFRQSQDAARSSAQRQGGLFGSAPAAPGKLVATTPTEKRDPKPGERLSLGSRVESEVQSLVGGNIGKTFDMEKPVKLTAGANMDGRRVHQQRVIKMLEKNGGRLGAWLGTGSGKTPTSIGAFTHLEAQGKASHGLFLVPTAVQNQFGEELANFTEPGRYRFQTGDGMTHADRVSMLADKSTKMRVMTHQSAARTVLQMAADHHGGISREAMLEKLRGMSDGDRAKAVRSALDAHGVPKHYTYIDEAHGLTTRQGEQESDTSIVLGALAHPTNSSHLLMGSATPHKNDTSEVYSMARMLDPERYSDAYKFTQSYGAGTVAAPDAVRRELDHLTYTASIPPDGVQRIDTPNPTISDDGKKRPGGPIALHPEHQKRVDGVTQAYEKATDAFRRGAVDVAATRKLSPDRFEGQPEDQHEAIAKEIAPHLGIIKETAIRKALQLEPPETNHKLQRMLAIIDHDIKAGRQSVVFSDSAEEAKLVHQALVSKGIAAGMYDGSLSGSERDKFRDSYDKGQIKVGVMTSAGEAGINMQSAKTIHHYDVPKTAKSHAQRTGRAYRQGQKDNVDVHDWTFDHEHDADAQRRLQDKSQLGDVFQSPLGPLDEVGFARDYSAELNKKHAAFDIAAK